jgi:hypothetical protein
MVPADAAEPESVHACTVEFEPEPEPEAQPAAAAAAERTVADWLREAKLGMCEASLAEAVRATAAAELIELHLCATNQPINQSCRLKDWSWPCRAVVQPTSRDKA